VALKDWSILVLEDEPAVLALVMATLAAGEFEDVTSASTIRDARALWEKNSGRFELFLTDFSLPDGSAPNFIAHLLREKPDLQVVLMSGLPEDALGLEPALSRAILIMPKPFRPSELLAFLKELRHRAVAA
jgi:two-component system cell cycle sensor histidine kinase/response regulator CckA